MHYLISHQTKTAFLHLTFATFCNPRLCQAHFLEEHAHDSHHGQTAVGKLRSELALLDHWVIGCDEFPSEVTHSTRSSGSLALGGFAERHPSQDLSPSFHRDFGNSRQTIWDVFELKASRRRKESRPFAGDFWCHVAHSRKHRNATMLDFSLTTALVGINITVSCESNWIPKSEGRLGTHLVLEGTQRRWGVVGPVTPGASSQAVLWCDWLLTSCKHWLHAVLLMKNAKLLSSRYTSHPSTVQIKIKSKQLG